ncbi:MAG: cysteine-rich CWC family protein [Myxococcota bacterium]
MNPHRDPSPSPSPDSSRCVLCGEPNDCELALPEADRSAPCWCVSEVIPKTLIESISVEERQKRCLCRRCLARHRATQRDEGDLP